MGMCSCKTLPLPIPKGKNFSNTLMPLSRVELDSKLITLGVAGGVGLAEDCLWTDGDKIYYSGNDLNMEFDSETLSWKRKAWNNAPPQMYGCYMWSDGTDIYSGYEGDYILNRNTDTWVPVEMHRPDDTSQFFTSRIWTDGKSVFYSDEYSQLIWDRATRTWNAMTWNGPLQFFQGYYVWTDGENIYYSCGDTYLLDVETHTWAKQDQFTGDGNELDVYAYKLWHDGTHVRYNYSYGSRKHYERREDGLWYETEAIEGAWLSDVGENIVYARNFWSDGVNIFWSDNQDYAVLLPQKVITYSYTNNQWVKIGTATPCDVTATE